MTLLISDTRYDSLDQYSDVRRNINDYNQRMSGELRPVRDTFADHKAFTPSASSLPSSIPLSLSPPLSLPPSIHSSLALSLPSFLPLCIPLSLYPSLSRSLSLSVSLPPSPFLSLIRGYMSIISHYSCSAICMMSLLCCLTCGGTCSLLVVYTGCSAFISSWSYSSFSSTLSYPLTSSLSLLWVYWVYWMTCSCW